MKQLLLFIMTCHLAMTVAAFDLSPSEQSTSYNHLMEVNKQWKQFPDASPQNQIQFSSDHERIKYHLQLVSVYLTTRMPDHLSADSKEKRKQLLEALNQYAGEGVFPINLFHSARQPYFIDHKGTHCAVGQLMAVSGHEEMAQKISQEYNYNYISEIPNQLLSSWAAEHGFTLDELAWIQPGYPPSQPITVLQNGPNDEVKFMIGSTDQGLFLAGDFTEIGGGNCDQVGKFKNAQFSCIGNDLDGTINGISLSWDNFWVAGSFVNNGETYPLATYKNNTWTYHEIPDRAGATGMSVSPSVLVIRPQNNPILREIWFLENNSWEKKASLIGEINHIGEYLSELVFAGDFDQVTIHSPGHIDLDVAVHNVVIKDYSSNNWSGLGVTVSDVVNVTKQVGSSLYIGGSCETTSEVCLSRYLNGTIQPLIYNNDLTPQFWQGTYPHQIMSLELYNSELYIAGDLLKGSGKTGKGLIKYDLAYGDVQGVAELDQEVNQVIMYNGKIYIGGAFTENEVTNSPLPYIGRLNFSTTTSTEELLGENELSVYPNPVSEAVLVEGLKRSYDFQLFDVSGKLMKSGLNQLNGEPVDVSNLASGVYFLKVFSEEKSYNFKILKEQ